MQSGHHDVALMAGQAEEAAQHGSPHFPILLPLLQTPHQRQPPPDAICMTGMLE